MFLEHNSNIILKFYILLCFENIMFLEYNVSRRGKYDAWSVLLPPVKGKNKEQAYRIIRL